MTERTKPCDREDCAGTAHLRRGCGAYVCDRCEAHIGLARCYCGWSRSGRDGRQELIEAGETIEPEDY